MNTTPFAIALFCTPLVVCGQGALEPPAGPPAPVMKSLSQIEPRADLSKLAGDTNYHALITQPGAYYLTENLLVTKAHGIDVRAAGVTIDLNGFEIRRAGGSGGNGIEIDTSSDRCTIRNGSIRGFQNGIHALTAANAQAAGTCLDTIAVGACTAAAITLGAASTLQDCRVTDGAGTGISAGNASALTRCTVQNLTAAGEGSGILAAEACTLTQCSVTNCQVTYGIRAGKATILENCSASRNTGPATPAYSYGIHGEERNILRGCSSFENKHAAFADGEDGAGFIVGPGSSVFDCVASRNQGDGFVAYDGSLIQNCRATTNGITGANLNGVGSGIHLASGGTNNHVIGNSVTNNNRGIKVDTTGNLILQNRASGNGATVATNYVIAANNRVGVILSPTANAGVINGSGGFTLADPWANLSY